MRQIAGVSEGFNSKHISANYKTSPLELEELDELYNITRVPNYREKFSEIGYLDNFYYYNQKVCYFNCGVIKIIWRMQKKLSASASNHEVVKRLIEFKLILYFYLYQIGRW